MSGLSELLLTALLNHGALILGMTLFLAALGLPLPATMLLMAAGAFSQQGMLAPESTLSAGLVSAIAGDSASYLVGRFGITRVPARFRDGPAWGRAAAVFSRWGAVGVLVTRFLLTPLALPVNLLAGSTHYPLRRFLGAVVLGEMLWVGLFAGAGYWFAGQWELISRIAGDFLGLLAGAAIFALGVVGLVLRLRAADTSRR